MGKYEPKPRTWKRWGDPEFLRSAIEEVAIPKIISTTLTRKELLQYPCVFLQIDGTFGFCSDEEADDDAVAAPGFEVVDADDLVILVVVELRKGKRLA